MDRLAEIDTEGVEPMSQVLYEAEETATLRPDVERAPLGNAACARQCAAAGQRLFQSPEGDRAMTAISCSPISIDSRRPAREKTSAPSN